MNRTLKILIVLVFLSFESCSLIQGYDSFTITNEFGRSQLKPNYIKLDKTFDKDSSKIIDIDAIYFHQSEDEGINMKFYFLIRFFEGGQYAFYAYNQKPIQSDSYELLEYNDLSKPVYVGYYNIVDSIVTLEKPNHLFRRGGRRNLDKYKILHNGNLKSITRAASDYNAVYDRIKSTEKGILSVEPDW
jgi:hypothetical protein